MLKYPNKILYIGAGCNIEPVKHFLKTKEFIFVDSQPRIKNENLHLETTFNKKEYVSDFVNNLLLTCVFNGFELVSTTVLDKNYHSIGCRVVEECRKCKKTKTVKKVIFNP
jgi:hypothetical protein